MLERPHKTPGKSKKSGKESERAGPEYRHVTEPRTADWHGLQRSLGNRAVMQRMRMNPQAAQSRPLQQTMGNRAAAQFMRNHLQRVDEEESSNAAGLEPASSSTPTRMPDPLKQGIEHLSGIDMSDVRVHYNSSEPARINALAFAKGNEIHLSPGQDRHLPHEAWHVVQQKQGQVRPTAKIGDVPVNDDAGLEREADQMGETARNMDFDHYEYPDMSQTTSNTDTIAQLEPIPYLTNNKMDTTLLKPRMEVVIQAIDSAVNEARLQALNWRTFQLSRNNYLKLWHDAANQFYNNAKEPPSFFYTRFGYAVETLACKQLAEQIEGLTLRFQVTHGHTRPDIVVMDGDSEIAWIDITSRKSVGHVLKKNGGGWKTKPFIYEIVYNSLNPAEVLNADSDTFFFQYGEFMEEENATEESIMNVARNRLHSEIEETALSRGIPNINNMGVKRGIAQDILWKKAAELGLDTRSKDFKNSKQITRKAMKYFGFEDSEFGFHKGKIKQSGDLGRWMTEKAAEKEIADAKRVLTEQMNDALCSYFLLYHDRFDAAKQFIAKSQITPGDRNLTVTGMLLRAAIEDYLAWEESGIVTDDLTKYLLSFPDELNDGKLLKWRNSKKTVEKKVYDEQEDTQDVIMTESPLDEDQLNTFFQTVEYEQFDAFVELRNSFNQDIHIPSEFVKLLINAINMHSELYIIIHDLAFPFEDERTSKLESEIHQLMYDLYIIDINEVRIWLKRATYLKGYIPLLNEVMSVQLELYNTAIEIFQDETKFPEELRLLLKYLSKKPKYYTIVRAARNYISRLREWHAHHLAEVEAHDSDIDVDMDVEMLDTNG